MGSKDWGEIRLGTGEETASRERDPEQPLRILIVGDFSGRGWRSDAAERVKPVAVDIDNFDSVLAWHKPFADVAGIRLKPTSIDDFHPDRLCAHPDLFLDLETEVTPGVEVSSDAPVASGGAGLLDAIVGLTEERTSSPVARGDLSGFIEEITAPHRERKRSAAEKAREEDRAEAESRRLRQVLHHPAFEAVERAWRGLDFLLRESDASARVRYYLLDASRAEIVQGAAATVAKIRRPAGDGWGVIALIEEFGGSDEEVAALREWTVTASAGRGVLLAGASPRLENGGGEEWEEFRRGAEARGAGLVLGRMLLRLPYGKDTDPVEGREFEEMADPPDPALYAWGDGVWACLAIAAEGFARYGWELRLAGNGRIGGRPVHTFRRDGEVEMQGCADQVLDDVRLDEVLEAGLMPLTASRGGDDLWLVRWQSVASPLSALSGWW
jgi:type VI secretion system protein ImpC